MNTTKVVFAVMALSLLALPGCHDRVERAIERPTAAPVMRSHLTRPLAPALSVGDSLAPPSPPAVDLNIGQRNYSSHPPETRGVLLRTLRAKMPGLSPLAFSPDSRVLVASGTSGPTVVFDIATGRVRRAIKHTSDEAWFSRDGKFLVTQNNDDTKYDFWRVRPWARQYRLDLADHLAFSPDSRRIALGSEGDTEIYKLETGRPVRGLTGYWQAVFSPDGRWIAASASKTYSGAYILYESHVDILDARTMRRTRRWSQWGEIETMTFSSNSRQLAIVENDFQGDGYAVHLWDATTDKTSRVCEVNEGMQTVVHSVRFLDHNRFLAMATDLGEEYRDVTTGKAVAQILQGGKSFFDGALPSPNGKLLASPDDRSGAIEIRSVTGFLNGAGK
ncbi:MAG TPA: WD40 repeat domain-containing protein [Capsulimonadaceae bacterium]|nr:WD40 repeat domain-containing protein [Capsulimonadaceae bacterium]